MILDQNVVKLHNIHKGLLFDFFNC